eukprot:TRINITY_DN7700_c0_g1_i1.p1 TRINITY_DN7700_c0_g1~~TRINITY_DN7700_c0_g1_i1.p1  ORF type:complete len:176 (+),score=47.53 TRINITY_DN7700_c0_g1_i1:75-602(+)
MFVFFFFKQKTAYEMLRSLVGSEMCIRDRQCAVVGPEGHYIFNARVRAKTIFPEEEEQRPRLPPCQERTAQTTQVRPPAPHLTSVRSTVPTLRPPTPDNGSAQATLNAAVQRVKARYDSMVTKMVLQEQRVDNTSCVMGEGDVDSPATTPVLEQSNPPALPTSPTKPEYRWEKFL